jgi:tetratricopeptide (TPR) repeat protein
MADELLDDPELLVSGVQRDPAAALSQAAPFVEDPSPRVAALALWTMGMAHRELGELIAARTELDRAWVMAMELEDIDLAGQIAITLSLVVAFQGDLGGALAILDLSEPGLSGALLGRLRSQRGAIHYHQGDFAAALVDYDEALELLTAHGDLLGELRQRTSIGAVLSYVGRLDDARMHLEVAVELGARLDQTLLQAMAAQNLAYVGAISGDFPLAFESFERAAEYFRSCGYDGPWAQSLRLDHARALLQANLLDEAQELADRSVAEVDEAEGELDLALSLLVAAEAHIERGDIEGGIAAAGRSVDAFVDRERPAWAALATAVLLRARASQSPTAELADEVAANAVTLEALGCRTDAVRANLLAAELRVGLGDLDGADALLRRAGRHVRSTVVHQPSALRVRALIEAARGNRAGARRAVNLGVRILGDHQAVLGAIELRAYAAANSDGLARIGVRLAIEDGRPRELLAQLEATRRTTSLLPAARPPDDDTLAVLLARLRAVDDQQRDAVSEAGPRAELDVERLVLERQIRNHVRRAPAGDTRADVPLAASLRLLGDRALLEYANLDGALYAVSVIDNRATLHELGPVDGLAEDVDSCVHGLHRLNRVQGSAASRASASDTLAAVGATLAQRLIPPRVARSGRPLVIVPTGVLHGLPWAVLPGLQGRPVSVTPSLTGWAIAHRRDDKVERVALVAGPGLRHAADEITALALLHPGADVLVGRAATADECLQAFGRSDLIHIACHGSYRRDNPLFSTLRLADGALTVFDLERSPAMPRTVVLSACNVAMGTSLSGGSLLGLASSLMTFGAGTIVAPLTPVSDEAVVPVMTRFHEALVAGHDPAEALAVAARSDDGRLDPTAGAFVTIGA